jgi:hypothetical protein
MFGKATRAPQSRRQPTPRCSRRAEIPGALLPRQNMPNVTVRDLVPASMTSTGTALIVIGAHRFGDGADAGPLYRALAGQVWTSAVLVEANPNLAHALSAAVAARNPLPRAPPGAVRVVNAGVCPGASGKDEKQGRPFFSFVPHPYFPTWATMTGSFDASHLERHLPSLMRAVEARVAAARGTDSQGAAASTSVPRFTASQLRARSLPLSAAPDGWVATRAVPCMPLHAILRPQLSRGSKQARGEGVGALISDVEGFDCKIVASHNWCAPRPARSIGVVVTPRVCGIDTRTRHGTYTLSYHQPQHARAPRAACVLPTTHAL